jgi:large subunit ribosomal protein L10e
MPKITKFTAGNPKGDFDFELRLVATEVGQIRHNALEAARVNALKFLSKKTGGESEFWLWVLKYPHHVLRENKMMAFAGADRLQDGMRLSFGKPIGTAARVNKQGEIIMVLRVPAKHLGVAKQALEIAKSKMPLKMRIDIVPLKKEAPAQ